MDQQDQNQLSQYEDISALKANHQVMLVRHKKSGDLYVKKTVTEFDPNVFLLLKDMNLSGIPRIHHLFSDGDKLIIIEEYIQGRTLDQRIKDATATGRGKSFSADWMLDVMLRLCSILSPLHSHKPSLIHRDIKASNVMIADDGAVFLLDFNAMKQYDQGKDRDTVLIGTVGYAAPEQYGFGQSDPRTDIFSLGKLLEKMVSSCMEANAKNLGRSLSTVIQRCTAMDPEDRYQNTKELSRALSRIRQKQQLTRDASASLLPPGFRARTPQWMILAGIGYALLVMICIVAPASPPTQVDVLPLSCSVFVYSIFLIFFFGNYRGLWNRWPLLRSTSLLRRVSGFVLYPVLGFILTIVIAFVIDDLIM